MSYETEQEQFAKELESVKNRFEILDNYFKQNPSKKENQSGYFLDSSSVVENLKSATIIQYTIKGRFMSR